jgi:hypothetical protein
MVRLATPAQSRVVGWSMFRSNRLPRRFPRAAFSPDDVRRIFGSFSYNLSRNRSYGRAKYSTIGLPSQW